jgi:hypothetical protein
VRPDDRDDNVAVAAEPAARRGLRLRYARCYVRPSGMRTTAMRALLAAAVATGCGSRQLGAPADGAAGGAGTRARGNGGTGAGGSAGTGAARAGGSAGSDSSARDASSPDVRDAAVCGDGPGCLGAAPGDCVNACDARYAFFRVCQDDAWICPSASFPVSSCWAADAAPPCGGSPAYCLPNGVAGGCHDVVPLAVCTTTGWACPGANYPSPCACIRGTYLCDAGIPDATAGDARPSDADASSDRMDGPSCDGPPIACAVYTGGTCSDALMSSVCTPSGWACPGGSIPFSQCRCVGAPRPGCVCGSSGFVCGDGGQ